MNSSTHILHQQFLALGTCCLLLLVACQQPAPQPSETPTPANLPATVTFAEHVAPIIYTNCMPCHHKGGAAPFALDSYRNCAKRAKMLHKVTNDRYMPPWPADIQYSRFANEKILTDHQIALLAKWYQQGAPLGDSTLLPPTPNYTHQSVLGKPDLVVRMPKPFLIKGDNTDRFLLVKIPYELPADTFLRAIEFVPDNRSLVHHVNSHLVQYDDTRKKNTHNGEWVINTQTTTSLDAFKKLDLPNDDGTYPPLTPLVCSYLPGVEPTVYPNNIGGWRVKKKGVILINDLHYGPSPKDTFDQSTFHFFFGKPQPNHRLLKEIQLGTLGVSEITPPLVIPPDTIMTFKTTGVVLGDISLLTINPHMHLLGKKFVAYAITPTHDTIPLIRINNWDFRWQYFYTYQHPIRLPKDTKIIVEGTFDNTTSNPNNPNHPPKTVSDREKSMRTTDEMLQFIFNYVPYLPGDENINLAQGVQSFIRSRNTPASQ